MKNNDEIKQRLLKAIKNDLPGEKSHLKMIPESRLNMSLNFDEKEVKKSAVLLFLFPENGTFNLLFIKRAKDGSRHSGQIAFPGGKFEYFDNGLMNTALRETEEEVGIPKENIKVIKKLSSLFIPVSNFMVYPYVGISDKKPDFKLNTDEVQEIYELDFRKLLSAKRIEKTFMVRNQEIKSPFYVFENFEIWGASAMILSEFIDLIKPEFR